LIEDIRNNFAFHYLSEDLQNQLQHIKNTGTHYIYLGDAHGNSFYSFADTLVINAMMSKVREDDPRQAMDVLFREPLNAIKWFLAFISSCMIILIEKHLGTTLDVLSANTVEVPKTIRWEDVRVPFFLTDEN
jgi:hypothetical protein